MKSWWRAAEEQDGLRSMHACIIQPEITARCFNSPTRFESKANHIALSRKKKRGGIRKESKSEEKPRA